MTKKTIQIVLLTVLCSASFAAQDRFFEFVDGWINNGCYEYNGEYVYMGLQTVGNLMEHELVYNRLNGNGAIEGQVNYFVDSTLSTSSRGSAFMSEFVNDFQIISAGVVRIESDNQLKGALYTRNIETEEVELLRTYVQDAETKFYMLEKANDSTLFIGGTLENGDYPDVSLYDMTLEGEIRWYERWGCGALCSMSPQQILPHSNGNDIYLLAQEYDDDFQTFYERLSAVLIKTDGLGQELWRVYPGDEENFWIDPGGIVELDDGILIAYANPKYYDSDGEWHANVETEIQFSKYDHSGNLMWEHQLDNNILDVFANQENSIFHAISKVIELEDGSIMLSGQMGYRAFLLKLNPDLDIIWYRLYTPHTIDENPGTVQFTILTNAVPTIDGGFMMTGQYDSAPGDLYPQAIQTAIAVKVDEFGCLEPGCQLNDTVGLRELEARNLRVYPNPVQQNLRIELPKAGIYQIEILDLQGRILRQEERYFEQSTALNFSNYKEGIYILKMLSSSGLYSSKVIKSK